MASSDDKSRRPLEGKTQPGMTARELLDLAKADPVFGAREEHRIQHEQASEKEVARKFVPLLRDLRSLGFALEGIPELETKHRHRFNEALPVLLEHLERSDDDDVVSAIAMTLWTARAKSAALALIKKFRSLASRFDDNISWVRDSLSNAIEKTASAEDAEALQQAIDDPVCRPHVALLLGAYAKLLSQEAVPTLVDLLGQRSTAAMAIRALGNLRSTDVEDRIRPFLEDEDSFFRNEAKKAISKFESARRRSVKKPKGRKA